jgi:hypothetical protein
VIEHVRDIDKQDEPLSSPVERIIDVHVEA